MTGDRVLSLSLWFQDLELFDGDRTLIGVRRNLKKFNYVEALEQFMGDLMYLLPKYPSCEENGYLLDADALDEIYKFANHERGIGRGDLFNDVLMKISINPPIESPELPITAPNDDEGSRTEDGDRLSVFRDMDNLMASEVTIEFAPGLIVIISARNVTKTYHCSEIDLYNRPSRKLNVQGDTLLDIAHGKPISKRHKKRISLIRGIFEQKLGVKDPFQEDWKPNFTVIDGRKKADDRAKANAKHVPLDGNNKDHGVTYQSHDEQDADEYPFDNEDDMAGELIRGNRE